MKLVIFGANGPTGRILTKQALDVGHMVTAVTRHPAAFPLRNDRLNVMSGDVFEPTLVEQAVAGQDAVLSTLGVPFRRQPITIYSQGMAHIVQAMNHSGVRRVICASSSSVGTNHDTGGGFLFDKILLPIILSTLGKTTYADMKQMETLLMKSELDWTVVRPSGLFETQDITAYQVAEDHIRGQFTSREDLADCMLLQLATDQYSRKVIAVATISMRPNLMKLTLQEAFRKPGKS